MYHFEHVTKNQAAPVKKELIAILHAVQDILRREFTFRYDFVGSASRNMITQDVKSNTGFDFDVNIQINDDEDKYSPEQIRQMLKSAFDRIAPRYGYSHAEQSTRVLTIKFKDADRSRILHSCDSAIVNNYEDEDGCECQQYIRYDKGKNRYSWEDQPDGYYMLQEKEEWIREQDLQPELRDWYLHKKCTNKDTHKKSRSIYADAVHEICQKYGYYD
jgi:hypothetical protein